MTSKKKQQPTRPTDGRGPSRHISSGDALTREERTLTRAIRLAESGQHQTALGVLTAAGASPQAANARGVCLMRLGSHEEAIRVFRQLVLKTGCTWMRPELPTIYKANFALALFLGVHPVGCREMLADINDERHPSVVRLRAAYRKWRGELSWWQRLNLWTGIEPQHPVSLDYPPGDFLDEQAKEEPAVPEQPLKPTSPTGKRAA